MPPSPFNGRATTDAGPKPLAELNHSTKDVLWGAIIDPLLAERLAQSRWRSNSRLALQSFASAGLTGAAGS